ncbi:helix-turn-helix domain-containing protein [Edaphobacter bradus]|uniref:helix-turn-helix domain-containing protein n=1 Tax=Edaphobacter bradus TaxID=2259016 RepID=UPI0021E00A26|nr:AraC family transcriptional regulator [Edaphobacter bradus]
MNARLIDSGILMGLGDARLSRAVEAMHQHPETSWSLEHLAQLAGMSRARFAVYFRQVVGMTPFDYLTNWRLGVAQTMLRRGSSLKLIASGVGMPMPRPSRESSRNASDFLPLNGSLTVRSTQVEPMPR